MVSVVTRTPLAAAVGRRMVSVVPRTPLAVVEAVVSSTIVFIVSSSMLMFGFGSFRNFDDDALAGDVHAVAFFRRFDSVAFVLENYETRRDR